MDTKNKCKIDLLGGTSAMHTQFITAIKTFITAIPDEGLTGANLTNLNQIMIKGYK